MKGLITVTVRIASVLIVVGVAVGVAPTVVGVGRSRVLSTVASALGLGGMLGLAASLTARRRRPRGIADSVTS